MRSKSLTCRCRFCGHLICYSSEDIGAEARCSGCGQEIRLPGKLAAVATIERRRRWDWLGIALEGGGFALMFLAVPWGILAGMVLVALGWRRTSALHCSNCNAPITNKAAESCPVCHTRFGSA